MGVLESDYIVKKEGNQMLKTKNNKEDGEEKRM